MDKTIAGVEVLRQEIQRLSSTELNRRQFIEYMLLVAMSCLGIFGIIKALTSHRDHLQTSQGSTYGHMPYGG